MPGSAGGVAGRRRCRVPSRAAGREAEPSAAPGRGRGSDRCGGNRCSAGDVREAEQRLPRQSRTMAASGRCCDCLFQESGERRGFFARLGCAIGLGGRCPPFCPPLCPLLCPGSPRSPSRERAVSRVGACKRGRSGAPRAVATQYQLPPAGRCCCAALLSTALDCWGKGKRGPFPEFRGAPGLFRAAEAPLFAARLLSFMPYLSSLGLSTGQVLAELCLQCTSSWQLS